jgi:aminoglycoside/choline kinase family phosphotransferase
MADMLPHLPELLATYLGREPQGSLLSLKAELSPRHYHRFTPAQGRSLMVMQLPDDGVEGPSREQARAFIDVQQFLEARGLPVPAIHAVDLPHGLLLIEDLGDETFEARLRTRGQSAWPELYGQAIDLLARLHVAGTPAQDPLACIALRRRYEPTLLRWELDHFREWGLEAMVAPLSAADRAALDAQFDALTAALVALPTGFVHRDYQSRNLMCAPERGLVILDFQDAFIGPGPYDLVALLCDSYIDLSPELQAAMLDRYAAARGASASEREATRRGFRLITVQRKLKDAGRFVFIDRVRANPSYLRFYPGSLRYVALALRELPEFADLHTLLLRLVPAYASVAA